MTLWRLGVVAASKSAAGAVPAGYVAGGNPGTSDIGKMAFSTEVFATLSAKLTNSSYYAGSCESSTNGYIAGGYSAPTFTNFTQIDKITFSNDSKSTLSSGLSAGRIAMPSYNSSTAGYFTGGNPATSATNKVTFSNDSVSTIAANFPNALVRYTSAANGSDRAYVFGGQRQTPPPNITGVTTVTKMTFSTETFGNLGTGMSYEENQGPMALESSTKGYVAGGRDANTGARITTINSFAFSDDSRAILGNGLATGRYGSGYFSSSTKGYVTAGEGTPSALNTTEAMPFSTETPAAVSGGNYIGTYGVLLNGFSNK